MTKAPKKAQRMSVFTFVLFMSVTSAVHANSSKYGMAGCGLGSIALPGKNGKEQIVATTLNSTGVQTVGITIGTSNCVDHPETASLSYIAVNQNALKKDAARGSGESIEGLGKILSCSNSALLAETLQKNYQEIFGATRFDSKEVNSKIRTTIQKTPVLQAQCLSTR